MMNLIKTVSLTAILGATLYAAGPIATRGVNQQQRIRQGVHSGQLTPLETARLQARERALHREITHDRITGNGLSPRERRSINRQRNALSHQIYRQKHDAQVRP
ncbi:MAG: hypothetical protein IANPNBLG_02674 [Bryobacteraceae bacterium]|nr:hypothetical protein [Bryobacteraceae bacterium]